MRHVSFFRPSCATSGRFASITQSAGPEATIVYVMLAHGSVSHITGLCHALPGALTRDTGLTLDAIEDALRALDRLGVIDRDTANSLVLVHGEFTRQCARDGKGAISSKLFATAQQRVADFAFSPLANVLAKTLGIPLQQQQKEGDRVKGRRVKGANTASRVSDTLSDTLSRASDGASDGASRQRGRTRFEGVHDA